MANVICLDGKNLCLCEEKGTMRESELRIGNSVLTRCNFPADDPARIQLKLPKVLNLHG
jgi:hypothetical protein